MPIIRQESLFDLQDLYNLEPTQRFDAIFSAVDIKPILRVVSKKYRFGAPVKLNDPAMISALIARITEHIPSSKIWSND